MKVISENLPQPLNNQNVTFESPKDGETLLNTELKKLADDIYHKSGPPELDQTYSKPLTMTVSKIDMTKYYYQYKCKQREYNIIAVWDTVVQKMRLFESECMLFGSLHSIYQACTHSSILEIIINTVFNIPCVMYIDDTVPIEEESI
ncbi:hypothetical protein, partial [Pseudoalteromonas sp.]|uniref:hypothetical protein n=1 Tax=Pseudoalteromonas sp. TaxID=53249 RepID=UPI0025800774